VYGADRFLEFKRTAAEGDGYYDFRAVNGAAGVVHLTQEEEEPELYTYTDQRGNTAVFFGPTYSGAAAWQLWKVADEAGNTAYVGSTNIWSALSLGYDG